MAKLLILQATLLASAAALPMLPHLLPYSEATAPDSGKGCVAVPWAKCGTDFWNSCLKCGDASAYDCEYCCDGCTLTNKGGYKYCECSAGPTPPPPGGDSWDHYTVSDMDVISVTGGSNESAYDKVIIMLHGGGSSNAEWQYNYQQGWFGDLKGLKYVFPTSAISSHVWFNTYKNECGLKDDCAYDIPSIQQAATRVAALIEHEKQLVGGDAKKVYLAGFSEGAQLTSYMQFAKLDYALGGVIVMDGYPLPPLCDMPGASTAAAQANASYYGQDMNWMIYWGAADPIFPAEESLSAYHGIFEALGVNSTLKAEHTEPGMSHTVIQSEIQRMVQFVRA